MRWTKSLTPAPPEAWRAAERVFAKLVARAYIADHPELFGGTAERGQDPTGSDAPEAAGEAERQP